MHTIIEGNLVDIFRNSIYPADISVSNGKIISIKKCKGPYSAYILPGLIDSHVHIESSMLTPAGFAELGVRHGTVAVVSDPHEIANVTGLDGINFMIENGNSVPLKFFFGAPSCVPATDYESSGARISSKGIKKLLQRNEIYFLSEMMNYPGVIGGDKDVLKKIEFAKKTNKPVDGHAPGLIGDELKKYIRSGISTDHECINLSEAEEKISAGMKIQIREGSAAKGFDIFYKLIDMYPESVMLCTDDIHPDDLVRGHINCFLARGVKKGVNIFNLVRAASLNPILHYKLPVGLLREGEHADFIVVKDLVRFETIETFINGEKVFGNNSVLFERSIKEIRGKFINRHLREVDIVVDAKGNEIRVIKVNDGDLYTESKIFKTKVLNGRAISDTTRDICKIIVVNRYKNTRPAVGFINGFGLKKGAIAGSIAHDSHNIIAVGVEDNDILEAVNAIIDLQGGLAVASQGMKKCMQLEIGGLMTNQDGVSVSHKYTELDNFAKKLGSKLTAPFMSLSFMSLLVIPELKIGDQGLFDVNRFGFTSVFVK